MLQGLEKTCQFGQGMSLALSNSTEESDQGKPSMGVRWAGEVSEHLDRASRIPDDPIGQREGVLTKGLRGIIQWVLAKARPLPSLKLPSNPDLSKFSASTSSSQVVDLESEAALQDLLQKNLTGFVEFFSPSCGACKKFAPVYESAARKAQANIGKHAFARIDCSTTLGEQSCNRHGIEAYPSVFYMHGGQMDKYPGGSKRKELLDYLATMTEPAVIDVASEEERPVSACYVQGSRPSRPFRILFITSDSLIPQPPEGSKSV